MREPRAQREQRLELARRELRLVDLAHLEDQEVAALLAVARRGAQPRELGRDLALARDLGRDARARRARARPSGRAAPRGARCAGATASRAGSRSRSAPRTARRAPRSASSWPADPRAAAPARRDRAAHDQLVLVAGEAALGELALELGQRVGAEHRLDDRLLGALAHRARERASAREQRERAEHDRLARAGLARRAR